MKRFIKYSILLVLILCSVMGLCGCGAKQNTADGKIYHIYDINKEETKLVEREYVSSTTEEDKLIQELLEQLCVNGEKLEYRTPLSAPSDVINYSVENGIMTLNFDHWYEELQGTTEVLVRAAIVRTLVQIPAVERVSFNVNGKPLTDLAGIAVGMMDTDTFIENAGHEINAYEKVNLHLYYANEQGDGLVEETRRNVVYNSNIPLEKLIVEKLIEGPVDENAYPVMNPSTKIVNVSLRDGVCYVNLSEDFLSQPYSVLSEVTVYAIANSLAEMSSVNKVQISVNGETNLMFRENISLNNMFERNLDLVHGNQ